MFQDYKNNVQREFRGHPQDSGIGGHRFHHPTTPQKRQLATIHRQEGLGENPPS